MNAPISVGSKEKRLTVRLSRKPYPPKLQNCQNCPEGKVTIAAAAEGAMPDQEVRAEIELEIVGTETK